jgi:micrococcal nuclease
MAKRKSTLTLDWLDPVLKSLPGGQNAKGRSQYKMWIQVAGTLLVAAFLLGRVPQGGEISAQPAGEGVVAEVIDGDTIRLASGETVRYIGVDTPETRHPQKGVECYGTEASNRNKQLVEGARVRLEKDVSDTDRYGRLLRYVYVDDTFINFELVAQGYARAASFPPDVAHQDTFQEAETDAREAGRGLWGAGCETE